jgi:hypothetical protein
MHIYRTSDEGVANYITKDSLMAVKASGGAIASSTAQAYSTIASNLDLAAAESATFWAIIKL